MTLERGQMLWRGVTLGPGTPFDIVEVTGLEDLPDHDYTGTTRPRQDGGYAGEMLSQQRWVTASIEIAAGNTAAARAQLRAITVPREDEQTEPLVARLDDDVDYHFDAQLLRRSMPTTSSYDRLATAEIQWVCPDPRRYLAADPDQEEAELGGTYSLSATNSGTTSTPLTLEITGPAPNPVITLTRPGGATRTIGIPITIGAHQHLILDALAGTAEHEGDDVYHVLVGAILEELLLPPGTSVISWHADADHPDALLKARWRAAEK